MPSAPHRHWTVVEVPQLVHARGPVPISGERHGDEPLVAFVAVAAAAVGRWPRGRMGVWQARPAVAAAAADVVVVVVVAAVGAGGDDVAHHAGDDDTAASGRDRTAAWWDGFFLAMPRDGDDDGDDDDDEVVEEEEESCWARRWREWMSLRRRLSSSAWRPLGARLALATSWHTSLACCANSARTTPPPAAANAGDDGDGEGGLGEPGGVGGWWEMVGLSNIIVLSPKAIGLSLSLSMCRVVSCRGMATGVELAEDDEA